MEKSFITDSNSRTDILKSQEMIVLNNDVNENAYNEKITSHCKLLSPKGFAHIGRR